MTEHEQIQEMFSEYLEGSLAPDQRRIVDDHLGQCTGCQGAFAALERTLASIQGLPRVRAPRGFAKRLNKRLQMSGFYRRRRLDQQRMVWPPNMAILTFVLILAALGMLVVLFLLSQAKPPKNPPSPSPPASSRP